ncbi:hypothetical protein SUGI_0538850, partial [Cryptomeria japonica]
VHAGLYFFGLSVYFFWCYIFLSEERKGRAEEEAEQPRAKSSSRHEMQGPARVNITDEEKKRRDVSYDLIPRSQVAAIEGNHIFKTANPLSFQYLI